MEIDEILDYALSLPDTEEATPFGPDTVVIKHHGKLFLILNLSKEPISFNYKADPEDIITQREDYSEYIIPGYHMNKTHWNSVYLNEDVSDQLLAELIDHSYELVYASLPKKVRNENPI